MRNRVEKFNESALKDGLCPPAVKWYLHMLDSLTVYYIQGENWTCCDNLCFPDMEIGHIWKQYVSHIRLCKLSGEDLKTLEDGLALIAQTEAYQNFGILSGIPFKDSIIIDARRALLLEITTNLITFAIWTQEEP